MVEIKTIDSVSGGVALDGRLAERLYAILSRLSNLGRLVDEDITSKDNNTFQVKGYADLVFKVDTVSKSVQERWECVTKGAATIKAKNLDRVTLLPQSFFELRRGELVKFVIAEERSKLAHSYTVVPSGYYWSGEELTPTLKQLTKFVIRHGLENTAPQNIPLLYEENGALAQPPRIALLDVEECENAYLNNNEKASKGTKDMIERALFGTDRHDGIFGLVQPDKLDAICDAAAEVGINVKRLFDGQLSQATEQCKRKAEKMKNLQKITAEEESFKEIAQEIVNVLEQKSGEKFGEVVTFEFQRSQFELAIRAFKCHDISGIIMKNEERKTVSWLVRLPPRLAIYSEVLPTFGCEKEIVRTLEHSEECILARTSTGYVRFARFVTGYKIHGPKFRDGVAL